MACAILGMALATGVSTQAPAPVHLGVPGRASSGVWLAADGNRVAAAWGAREPGGATDVYVAVSADGGRTFGEPVRVNDRPGTARVSGEMAPRVAFSRGEGGPALEVLWTAHEDTTTIRLARSRDGGRTFGASRLLQRAQAPGDRGWGALATDSLGGVHALWLDHRGMAAPGAAGGAHHGHDAAAPGAPAVDGAAMAQRSALYYSDGTTEREVVKGVCYCCKTALAAGAGGMLFAAWRHVYPGNIRDIAFTTSRDGGRSFEPPIRVSEDDWQLDGCPDDGPAIDVDAAGAVHLVWPTVVTQPIMHKALFYATSEDGRHFSARMRVSPIRRNIAHPQIAVAPRGEIAVFWDEIVNGRRHVFLSRKVGAEGFGAAEEVSDSIAASYPMPVFADGAFVVAWTDGSGDASRIAVRRLPVEGRDEASIR